MSSRSAWQRYRWLLLALVVPVAGLLWPASGHDDNYITYFQAWSLVHTGRLANVNAIHFEQSTSLGHTLLLALVAFVTRAPVPLLGSLLAIVAGCLCPLAAYRVGVAVKLSMPWLAGLLVGLSVPLAYWTYGGLETSLAVLVMLLVVLIVVKATSGYWRWWYPLPVAFAVLVRPDMMLVLCTALPVWWLATVLFRERRARLPVAMLASAALVSAGAVTLFRLVYFHSVFPAPVAAKTNGHLFVQRGLDYLQETFSQMPALYVVCGFAIIAVFWWLVTRQLAPLFVPAVLLLMAAVTIASGGDWMEGGRLLAIPVALSCVAAAGGVGVVADWLTQTPVRRLAPGVAVACALSLVMLASTDLLHFATTESTATPAWLSTDTMLVTKHWDIPPVTEPVAPSSWYESSSRVHARDPLLLGPLRAIVARVARHQSAPVTVASGQAGMLMYYLFTSLPPHSASFVDRFSLTTDLFSNCARHNAFGASVSWQRLTTDPEHCGLTELPQVVTDLQHFGDFPGLADKYHLVYAIIGPLTVADSTLQGRQTSVDAFIAVRNDVFDRLSH